jgi:hypothetical protein
MRSTSSSAPNARPTPSSFLENQDRIGPGAGEAERTIEQPAFGAFQIPRNRCSASG